MSGPKTKQSLYFPDDMLREMTDAAARLDRSLSWIVQRAWRIARQTIKDVPAIDDGPRTGPASGDSS